MARATGRRQGSVPQGAPTSHRKGLEPVHAAADTGRLPILNLSDRVCSIVRWQTRGGQRVHSCPFPHQADMVDGHFPTVPTSKSVVGRCAKQKGPVR